MPGQQGAGRLELDRGNLLDGDVLVALAALQVPLALPVRPTLTPAAAEGARAGALAGSGLRIAESRTRDVLASALGGSAAQDVVAARTRIEGVEVVQVRITARLPLLGTLGPTALTVEGHAMAERL